MTKFSFPVLYLQTPGTAPPNAETEAKSYEGKERPTNKKSKGTSGNGNVRIGETVKAASSSGNDGATQRFVVTHNLFKHLSKVEFSTLYL